MPSRVRDIWSSETLLESSFTLAGHLVTSKYGYDYLDLQGVFSSVGASIGDPFEGAGMILSKGHFQEPGFE